MPKDMSEEELESQLESAESEDTFEYRNEADEDDYIIAELYCTTDGRHFRYVESSGMNSTYAGAGEIGEWLSKDEVKTWSEF